MSDIVDVIYAVLKGINDYQTEFPDKAKERNRPNDIETLKIIAADDVDEKTIISNVNYYLTFVMGKGPGQKVPIGHSDLKKAIIAALKNAGINKFPIKLNLWKRFKNTYLGKSNAINYTNIAPLHGNLTRFTNVNLSLFNLSENIFRFFNSNLTKSSNEIKLRDYELTEIKKLTSFIEKECKKDGSIKTTSQLKAILEAWINERGNRMKLFTKPLMASSKIKYIISDISASFNPDDIVKAIIASTTVKSGYVTFSDAGNARENREHAQLENKCSECVTIIDKKLKAEGITEAVKTAFTQLNTFLGRNHDNNFPIKSTGHLYRLLFVWNKQTLSALSKEPKAKMQFLKLYNSIPKEKSASSSIGEPSIPYDTIIANHISKKDPFPDMAGKSESTDDAVERKDSTI